MVKRIYLPLFITIAVMIVLLDQAVKFLMFKIQPTLSWGVLSIRLVKNTGAGFGILQNQAVWLALISLIVAIGVIIYYPHIPQKKLPQILFAFFLGGVIGNLMDRAFRRFVIDFIDFSFWPAFNIADAAITIAVIGLVIYFWRE